MCETLRVSGPAIGPGVLLAPELVILVPTSHHSVPWHTAGTLEMLVASRSG